MVMGGRPFRNLAGDRIGSSARGGSTTRAAGDFVPMAIRAPRLLAAAWDAAVTAKRQVARVISLAASGVRAGENRRPVVIRVTNRSSGLH